MSDEEKKAIERLNKRYEFFKENPLATNVWLTLDIHNLGIALNLIEKQQKEIEELKENTGYHLGFIDGGISKRYEMEDKIKAKIEEVNAEELNLAFIISGVEYKKAITSVLQSLLEKE